MEKFLIKSKETLKNKNLYKIKVDTLSLCSPVWNKENSLGTILLSVK